MLPNYASFRNFSSLLWMLSLAALLPLSAQEINPIPIEPIPVEPNPVDPIEPIVIEPEVIQPEPSIPPTPPSQPAQRTTEPAQPAAQPEAQARNPLRVPAQPVEPEPGIALFDLAMTHYESQDWQNAYNRFNSYLRRYPQGKQVAWAEFRMGECARRLNIPDRARAHYQRTIQRHPDSGEPVASASFQLGVIYYLDNRFDRSAPLFSQARELSNRTAVQIEANFLLAISSEQLEDFITARKAYATILEYQQEGEEPPPHLSQAHLSLARLKKSDLRSPTQPAEDPQIEAQDQELITQMTAHLNAVLESEIPKNQAQTANGYTQRGLLKLRNNDLDGAIRDLRLVIGNASAIDQDLNSARFGLMEALYRQERWREVVAQYQQAELLAKDPLIRARLHLMGGNAYLQSQRSVEAILAYDAAQREAPLSPPGTEAGYRKLLVLSQQQDPNILTAAKAYISEQQRAEESPWIDRARLIIGDYHLRNQDQKQALEWFDKINDAKNLFPEFQGDYFYKLGWLQTRDQQYAAASQSLTELRENYPSHPEIAQAQVMRAHCAWKLGNVGVAEEGFREVIETFGQNPAAESAWRQLGELKMELGAPEEAITAFNGLLSNFPQSKSLAEIYSRLGEAYRQVENYPQAIAALETSADLDPRRQLYAISLIIPSYRALEDLEGTAEAVDLGLRLDEDLPAARSNLLWLGAEFYNRKNFGRAVKYLGQVREAELVLDQRRVLHLYLARSLTQSGRYAEASIAYTNYLALEERPVQRAQALVGRSRSLLEQGKFKLSQADIQAGQELIQEGRTHAELSLLAGDLALAQENWQKAARAFVAPANAFVDPLITPYAYTGMIRALEELGQQEQATEYRKLLAEGYPNWQARQRAPLAPRPENSPINYIQEATPLEPQPEQSEEETLNNSEGEAETSDSETSSDSSTEDDIDEDDGEEAGEVETIEEIEEIEEIEAIEIIE